MKEDRNNIYIGKRDIVFIAFFAALALVFLLVWNLAHKTPGSRVVVTRSGEVFGIYELNEDQTVEITDSEGRVTNVLVIEDGAAYMWDADCPDKLCIHQGKISNEAGIIVCLPNEVVVSVESEEDNGDVDIVVK